MKKKAYVSSTSKDLNEYRLAVTKTIKQMGYEDVAMEYYSTEGRPPLKRCQEDVEDCESMFVLLLGITAPYQRVNTDLLLKSNMTMPKSIIKRCLFSFKMKNRSGRLT